MASRIMRGFISSKTSEMKVYRDVAIETVKEAGMSYVNYNEHVPISQGRRSIFELDRDTVTSSDVFVGLYGFEGTWRPASEPALVEQHPELAQDPDRFIIEYEYEWALKANLYLFPFLRTDQTEGLPHSELDIYMDRFRMMLRWRTVGWLKTPELFHRELLDALRSIRPRVFLSYSRRDEEVARNLQQALRGEDIHCWRDVTDIPGSAEWAAMLEQSLAEMDALLVLVTPNSAQSEWVAKECAAFLERGKPVLPYVIDAGMLTRKSRGWGRLESLRARQFVNGTNGAGFARLVKDLRPLLPTARA
jgi:hypothetical protein